MKYPRHQLIRSNPDSTEMLNNTLNENVAAAKIQAGFRGYQVRKHMKQLKDNTISKNKGKKTAASTNNNSNCSTSQKNLLTTTMATATTSSNDGSNLRNESFSNRAADDDILEKSATKIQAGIRGFLTRKKIKSMQK